MTEQEKKLLQAKHRMEEAEARNRKKERSIRTRRLIQEGAILESVSPGTAHGFGSVEGNSGTAIGYGEYK